MFSNKCFLIISCLAIFNLAIHAKEQSNLNRDEVLSLLHYKTDMLSIQQSDDYKKLLSYGDRSFPVLAAELLKTNDDSLANCIMDVFIRAEGDKTIAINAVGNFIKEKPIIPEDKINVYINAIEVLGNLGGGKQQADLLFKVLEKNSNWNIRAMALRTMGRIGDLQTEEEIQKWVKNYKGTANNSVYSNVVIEEAEKTIIRIQDRVERQQLQSKTKSGPDASVITLAQTCEQKQVVETKGQISNFWQLPLLIGVLVASGVVGVWLYFRK
jgi:hypothetical protein